ncbi:MAG: hypothetical protein D6729_05645 [Deltaproteobacteria bacterium]|nr:MAG: hypothetical protein D6729_05645 [Deltaproteobacteria bacterium]
MRQHAAGQGGRRPTGRRRCRRRRGPRRGKRRRGRNPGRWQRRWRRGRRRHVGALRHRELRAGAVLPLRGLQLRSRDRDLRGAADELPHRRSAEVCLRRHHLQERL